MDRVSKRRQNLEPLVRQRFRKYQEDETLRRLQWLIGLIQKPDEEFQKHKSQDRDLSDRLAIFCGSAPEAFKALRTAGIVALVHEVRAMVKAWRDGKPWTVTTTVGLQLIPKGSRAARYK